MRAYLDTSVIVAALVPEDASERVVTWLEAYGSDACISDWVVAEISSALSMKIRTGQISAADRHSALARFRGVLAPVLAILPVTSVDFRAAAGFADQEILALRGADALHLAVAREAGAALATLDRRLAAAGSAIGMPILTP